MPAEVHLTIRNAIRADGIAVDVAIVGGVIQKVSEAAVMMPNDGIRSRSLATTTTGSSCRSEIDATGMMILPSAVEPHAHLDKALLVGRAANETNDLPGAIAAMKRTYRTLSDDDIATRATSAAGEALAHGFTALRTHVDCNAGAGLGPIRALIDVKRRLAPRLDIQVVALSGCLTDPNHGRRNRSLLVDALAAGADVVGGCPALEHDGARAISELLAIAREHGCDVDLHIDETLDPVMAMLRELAGQVLAGDFPRRVTASHCVSLGMQAPAAIAETARMVAEAGITIVTLPQTNLFLQGRGHMSGKPRGLPPLAALGKAGVVVAGGGDNWRDPFNPMSRIDPMETASLLVTAGQIAPAAAYAMVTDGARAVMGLTPTGVVENSVADLLLIEGDDLSAAVAKASEHRIVIKGGTVVARTEVRRTIEMGLGGCGER